MADDEIMQPCPNCKRELITRNGEGMIVTPHALIVNADMICRHCGERVYWRRNDITLRKLVDRLVGGRVGGER